MSLPKRRILFLLRTYNDIDHIVPIIWKCVACDWKVSFLFADKDFSHDARIKFIISHGASLVESIPINFYHEKIRPGLSTRLVRPATDRLVAYVFGLYLLHKNKIEGVVNEWSGGSGRAKASYFLKAARLVGLPTFCLPHGYFIWKNPLFNREIADFYRKTKKLPNFNDRNLYSRYVVHSSEQRAEAIRYGIKEEKLIILGCARFCREWTEVNWGLLSSHVRQETRREFVILFFLPHWDYNVYRKKCINLIEKLSQLKETYVEVKAHTRGTGALDRDEMEYLCERGTVGFANESQHSAALVRQADLIINFGSSVGFEALQQGKPVINPRYLHGNQTFFDDSGVVIDTHDDESTVAAIGEIQSEGGRSMIEPNVVAQFLNRRVEYPGIRGPQSVLESYLWLLSGQYFLDSHSQQEQIESSQ